MDGWRTTHNPFIPRADAETSVFEQLKRLSEFSLILIFLTSTRRLAAEEGYSTWAQRIAQVLWNDLHAMEKGLCAAISTARSSTARAMLLAFPALESLARRRLDSHDQVMGMLAQSPCTDINLAFTRDVAGLHDCRVRAGLELIRIIERSATMPGDETVQTVYDLTHITFYATKMGQRLPGWDRKQNSWVHARLESFATTFLCHRDLDIVSESVTSLIMAGSTASQYHLRKMIDAVAGAAETEGSIPPHPRHHDKAASAFADRYHSTLVGLAAVAAFETHNRRYLGSCGS